MKTKKFCLTERQMPAQWYNIVADMPNRPLPPLHPVTREPVTREQLSAVFAEELIEQEMSVERFIDIPEEVQEIYRIWRPTPLVRATGLEKALDTPASRPPARTSPTRPYRRPTTTTSRASAASRPRRAPDNGVRPSPSRDGTSASTSRFTWSA